jgi:predicted Zn-dependent peptidase
LVLTGDIDAATARPIIEKWFGDIPRGPAVRKVEAGPVTLAAPVSRQMTDQVPVTRLTRNWSGPGLNDPEAPALEIGLHILGGLASSRLDNALVRGEQLAVAVTAGAMTFEQVSFLQATMDVKPGVDPKLAERRFDEVLAEFVAEGPTEDEVRRAVTRTLSAQIGGLERVGGFYGKGATLAEGELYSGDPGKYRDNLTRMAALTPADIRAALQRWLTRPVFSLDVVPGERTEDGATMGGWGDEVAGKTPPPDAKTAAPPLPGEPARKSPPVAPVAALDFPKLERARLANGIPVALARRTAIPKLIVSLGFDAGIAADALDTPGTQELMLDMLDEGTASRNATEIAEQQERLGASISSGAGIDASSITLSALTANLTPSLELMADVVRNPAFDSDEVARLKDQKLAELAQTLASPRALAGRELGKLLYGDHPYAQPADGLGDAASLSALTPQALRAAHDKWLRPDMARITVVGDITMDRLLPLLEKAFGDWQAPATPKPAKNLAAAIPAPRPRIVLIDRPNSPQSVIYAGRVLPVTGRTPDMEVLDLANEVLGGGFLSRLNTNLREEKSWSYGVYSSVRQPKGPRAFLVAAPVQADRTGDSIRAILADMAAFPDTKPIEPDELNRVTDGNIRALPNRFERNADVLSAILTNQQLDRPDDYFETLADRFRAIDAQAIDAAAKTYLQPGGLTFVVVGDRKQVEPQLDDLGLPVEIASTPDSNG